MPSMLDTLVFTPGLARFEVVSMTRACIEHLKTNYWNYTNNHVANRPSQGVISNIMAAFAVALDQVINTQEHIIKCANYIKEGRPIKSPRSIDVFDLKEMNKFRHVLDLLNDPRKTAKVSVKWNKLVIEREYSDPKTLLLGLLPSIRNLKKKNTTKCHIENGRLHGDPHFGNFLIDSSIPEDPLVVSIDPSDISGKFNDLKVPRNAVNMPMYRKSREKVNNLKS